VSKWKPRHHIGIYDYNYKVGSSYYNPQTDYIGDKPLERNEDIKPPEAQTFAERFASKPIYGKTTGLPYDETKSVFRQPMAIHSAGTRSRASSLTRDSGTSQYLSSLGPKSAFNRDDSRMSRQLSDQKDHFKLPFSGQDSPSWASKKNERVSRYQSMDNLNSRSSLPPRKRTEEREVTFKKEYGPTGQEIVKRQEVRYLSSDNTPSTRRINQSEATSARPPLDLRYRRSSLGQPGDSVNSKFISKLRTDTESEFQKLASAHMNFGMGLKHEEPRFRSAQNFREARRKQESDELSEKIKKTVNNMKSRHLEDATKEVRPFSRFVRSGSLDPFESEKFESRSRRGSRVYRS